MFLGRARFGGREHVRLDVIGLLLEANVLFDSHTQMAVVQMGIFQLLLEVRYIFQLCCDFDFVCAEMKAVGLVCAFHQFLGDAVCQIANGPDFAVANGDISPHSWKVQCIAAPHAGGTAADQSGL